MRKVLLLIAGVLLLTATVFASVNGSITGRVTDSTGGVIPGATVTATNMDTRIATATTTNADGSYSLPDLAVGHYSIQVKASGFSVFQENGIVLDVNTALRIDAPLKVGSVSQQVQVNASAVQVDTISTQLGQVIGSTAMTSLPLNGRAYTDLLALQPGVVPQSNESTTGVNSYSNSPPSGGLDDGTLSISGARGSSNGPSCAARMAQTSPAPAPSR